MSVAILRAFASLEGMFLDEVGAIHERGPNPTLQGIAHAGLQEGALELVGIPAGYVWRDEFRLTAEARALVMRWVP